MKLVGSADCSSKTGATVRRLRVKCQWAEMRSALHDCFYPEGSIDRPHCDPSAETSLRPASSQVTTHYQTPKSLQQFHVFFFQKRAPTA